MRTPHKMMLGMIPVAANHPRNVIDRNVLPRQIADVLPAGNFFQNEQAHFVAGIQKMARLRIVRRPHDVAVHYVAENIRVAALAAARHRLADERIRLMAIESAQLDHFAVQLEAVIGELGMTKADSPLVAVEKLRAFQQAHVNCIQDCDFGGPTA